MTPDTREAVVERLRQYLTERRTFELNAAKRSREATPRGAEFAPAEVRAELREEYRGLWMRHMAGSAQFPGLQYESPPQVDWDRTVVLDVVVRNDHASVRTTEPGGPNLPPDTYEYSFERQAGEWRLQDRRTPNQFPPPKWIRGLL